MFETGGHQILGPVEGWEDVGARTEARYWITTSSGQGPGPTSVLRVFRGFDESERKHLAEELQSWAQISRPDLAEVLDLTVLDDRIHIVHPGYAARTISRYGAAMGVVECVALVADAADGLQALHDLGYVHGAVTPERVLIDGAAGRLGDPGPTRLLNGRLRGTRLPAEDNDRVGALDRVDADMRGLADLLSWVAAGASSHGHQPPPPHPDPAVSWVTPLMKRCLPADDTSTFECPGELAKAIRQAIGDYQPAASRAHRLDLHDPNSAPSQPVSIPAGGDDGPIIEGVICKNGHVNHPNARVCTRCGVNLDAHSLVTGRGPRPPLGVLIFQDGLSVVVSRDLVIGRNPTTDERVVAGAADPITLPDAARSVSRAHLLLRAEGWEVSAEDLSSYGTWIRAGEEDPWVKLASGSHRLDVGTMLRLGKIEATYSPLHRVGHQ